MNTLEAIYARRSIRAFTDQPVPDACIQTLLECAMAAPSACNKRPWLFYVVKDAALREKLRHVSRYSDMNAALDIVVAGDSKRALTPKVNDFWIQDCSAATQNILLAAAELGLGACWCGLFPGVTPVKRVREILSLPENAIPLSLVHIGFPAQSQPPRTQYDAKRVQVFAQAEEGDQA